MGIDEKARRLFNEGYALYHLRRMLFPELYSDTKGMGKTKLNAQRADATKAILSALGFRNHSEYERAYFDVQKQNRSKAENQANEWNDEAKSQRILELFKIGAKLNEIRMGVFSDWFSDKPKHEYYHNKIVADCIILRVLECKDWDDYNRKRRQMRNRLRYRKSKQEGMAVNKAAIKAALERDRHRCVITGSEEKPNVHHIDGDRSNNEMDNLVTLSKEVHLAIHNGARARASRDLEYWTTRNPDYVSILKKRMDYMQRYVAYLNKKGYREARIECIPGWILFGPDHLCRNLNINPRRKQMKGWYSVVVLQSTGLHEEPKEYRPKYESYQWTEETEDIDEDDYSHFFNHEEI